MSWIDRFIRKTVTEINRCTHGGRLMESIRQSGGDFLDFSASLNPLGPPNMDQIENVISRSLEHITCYPDNSYQAFRAAAARYTGADKENIIPANGSAELIRLTAETILDKGDTAIIPQPTFAEYELNVRLMGAIPDFPKYKDIYRSPSSLSDPVLEQAKAVCICNPNNPTGTLIGRSDLETLAERCRQNETFLVIDEAFIQLSDPAQSMADKVNENPFIIVLRSLTKEFAIPGIRIGYAIAHPDLALRMDNIRVPWNLGTISEAVGTMLMNIHSDDPSFLERSRQFIKTEREWLIENLSLIRGFQPFDSSTNFILVRITDFGMDSREITQRMHDHRILIRNCESFRLMERDYIRIAVRTREENQKLLAALADSVIQWGRELAEQKIGEALHEGRTVSRTNCEYYPCHFEGQDCTFCFCPFYPCMDTRTGGQMIERSTGGQVWSCSACDLIHRSDVANRVLEALIGCEGKPDDLKRIWKKIMEPKLSLCRL